MIVIVTGGRGVTDPTNLWTELDKIQPRPTLIVEGGQRTRGEDRSTIIGGADFWGNRWADKSGIPCQTVRADWSDLQTPPVRIKTRPDGRRYNALAGFARNGKMLQLFKVDLVVAAPGGEGTKDMVAKAYAAGIAVVNLDPAHRQRALA